jgi:2-methylcitrate dehydratase PrpD
MIRREFFKKSFLVAGAVLPAQSMFGLNASAAAAPPPCEPAEFPKSPGLTESVANFIVQTKYEDIPANVIELGKKTILDGFGLALAGSVSASGPVVRQYLATLGLARGKASIIGTRIKVPTRFAALANGVAIHADDYDDTGSALHVNAPVLPAAFALCELNRVSGKDFMLAYQVGVEVENKVGDAMSRRHDEGGFHTTGTCGVFGSAAACAKLQGLNPALTARALGLAASQASGVRDNFGTMTKPFHAGHAAEAGVLSVDLVRLGWTASEDILEAPLGFYQAEGGSYDPRLIAGKLGNPWMFAAPGDLIKRFPCGTIQQAVMDEMLRLIQDHNLKAAEVEKVEIGGNAANVATLFRHHPKTGLEAKFSMEYAVSILLVEGKAGLAQFADAVVQRPDVQAMVERSRFFVDPEYNQSGRTLQATLLEGNIIRIYLRDGRVIRGKSTAAKGSPKNPMTYDEVAEKFRGNAEFAQWPRQKTESVIAMVKSLEAVTDMRKFTAALAG